MYLGIIRPEEVTNVFQWCLETGKYYIIHCMTSVVFKTLSALHKGLTSIPLITFWM